MMRQVGILYHPKREPAVAFSSQLEQALLGRGLKAWRSSSWEEEQVKSQLPGTDLVISVGGDGTILRTARAVAPFPVPILGVNLGKLGFLSEMSAAEMMQKLPAILDGSGWVEQRAMLQAEVSRPEGKGQYLALNDVVVTRAASARLIQVEVRLDGAFLTAYRADGVIVSTATGSTGYSLAAGGPILHPETKDIVLKPICPHFSIDQALTLPSETTVFLKLSSPEAMVSIDGQVELPLRSGDEVKASLSQHRALLLRLRPRSYFYKELEQILKGKTL